MTILEDSKADVLSNLYANATLIDAILIDPTFSQSNLENVTLKNYLLSTDRSFDVTETAINLTTAGQPYIAITDTTTASPRTITLSTADATEGKTIIIKDAIRGAELNPILINTQGAETIEGQVSTQITVDGGEKGFTFANGEWKLSLTSNGTQSIFYLLDFGGNNSNYRIRTLSSSANRNFTFHIPSDFSNLVSLVLIGSPGAGGAGGGKDVDLTSSYALVGENIDTNSESDTTSTYNFGSQDDFFALPLDSVFSNLEALHICGINVDQMAVGGAIDYYGILLQYQ